MNDEAFYVRIGRKPTVHVLHSGEWFRDDGYAGDNSQELLSFAREERGREILEDLRSDNLKKLALNCMQLEDRGATCITKVVEENDEWIIDYRDHRGLPVKNMRISDVRGKCRAWAYELIGRN